MRNRIATFAIAACLTLPAIALAQVPAAPGLMTADDARDTAAVNGVVNISWLAFYDGRWKIEGRDTQGRYVKMWIDGNTGQIVNLYRD